jgi:hypothetical protein
MLDLPYRQAQKLAFMKRLPGVWALHWRSIALVGIAAILLTQLPALMDAAKSERHETVTIEDNVILLHPGTKLTKPDRQAFNQILGTYNKSLFKVETYKDGKVTRTQGQLSEALIDKTIAAEAAQAKASGNSHLTMQIIAAATSEQLVAEQASAPIPSASTNPQRIQNPTPTATPPPNAEPSASTNPQRIQSPTPTATPPPNAEPSASTNPQRIKSPTPTATPPPNAPTNPQRIPRTPIPGASTNPERHTAAVGEKASRELIERLKPILEKYSKK